MAQDEEWNVDAFVMYDRGTDQVTIRDMRGVPEVEDGEEYYYWAEPHTSANPELARVLFTTNWDRFDTARWRCS